MVDIDAFLGALLYVVPAVYALAFTAYLVVFAREAGWAVRAARPLLVLAVTLNLGQLVAFTTHYQHIPAVTVHQVLGAIGFAIAATYLWVETRTRTPHTGPFVLGLVLICQLDAMLHPRFGTEVPALLNSAAFSVHVTAAILGYSAFGLAAVYGLIYLLLYNEMRLKRFGLIFRRLPPLAVLDTMNFFAAGIGFAFLTVAVLIGSFWAAQVFSEQLLDPKLIVGWATWAIYGAALFGRRYRSWRGPRLAYSSVLSFVAVLLSMVVVNYLLSRYHIFS